MPSPRPTRSSESRFGAFAKRKHEFAMRVIAVVRDIPKGEALSYGEVARKAGYPGAARAVGNVMRHVDDKTVPFYRVVRADGSARDAGARRRARALKEEQ